MKDTWKNITALVYSLGYKSVNALEDGLKEGKVQHDDERVLLIDKMLGEVEADRLVFS